MLNRLRHRYVVVFAALFLTAAAGVGGARAGQADFSNKELIDGFMKTVFGLEYRTWNWQPYLVKKYTAPVRFYVHNLSRRNRKNDAVRFINGLSQRIRGLRARAVSSAGQANFIVYIVDRKQYGEVVRREIYGDPAAHAPGRCLVRVLSDSSGISQSTAVIVADEGEFLFRRCLVEEVLQGLGPMNDDRTLRHSVFNDRSRHDRFTEFDRYILNMLYHRRIRPGMSQSQARDVLPGVVRDVRRYVH